VDCNEPEVDGKVVLEYQNEHIRFAKLFAKHPRESVIGSETVQFLPVVEMSRRNKLKIKPRTYMMLNTARWRFAKRWNQFLE